MIKKINIKNLAYLLAIKKVEKKFRKSGYSPYNYCNEEYVGQSFTKEAQKIFNKEYEEYLETINKVN
tara:strand:+ start:7411 stop:7611 length:201 start_codon:yes stop_codon:yes gene_type:complete